MCLVWVCIRKFLTNFVGQRLLIYVKRRFLRLRLRMLQSFRVWHCWLLLLFLVFSSIWIFTTANVTSMSHLSCGVRIVVTNSMTATQLLESARIHSHCVNWRLSFSHEILSRLNDIISMSPWISLRSSSLNSLPSISSRSNSLVDYWKASRADNRISVLEILVLSQRRKLIWNNPTMIHFRKHKVFINQILQAKISFIV